MRRLITKIALATSAMMSSGCATLLAAGPSKVDIRVDGPKQAAVIIQAVDKEEVIKKRETHFHVVLDRYSSYAVYVVADGYEPRLARLRSEVHPLYQLNLVPELAGFAAASYLTGTASSMVWWGGLIVAMTGMTIDDITKSGRRHETQLLVIPMRKMETEPKPDTL